MIYIYTSAIIAVETGDMYNKCDNQLCPFVILCVLFFFKRRLFRVFRVDWVHTSRLDSCLLSLRICAFFFSFRFKLNRFLFISMSLDNYDVHLIPACLSPFVWTQKRMVNTKTYDLILTSALLFGTICLKHPATLILLPLSKVPSRLICLKIVS